MRLLKPIIKNYDWGMPHDAFGGEKVAELWWPSKKLLLKVLFVEKPLSLQLHPSEEQLSLHPFPDPLPKPEVLIALTDGFQALCGFHKNPPTVPALLPFPTLASLFQVQDKEKLSSILFSVREYALSHPLQPPFSIFLQLHDLYPQDPTSLAPFYMNHVSLQRNQALLIHGGQPHCYLQGQGVECMPYSDNIVRCGLTTKECQPDLFFELCHHLPVLIKNLPYDDPILDQYFTLHLPHECLYPKGSIVLTNQGAWQVEDEQGETIVTDDPLLLVVVPSE